MIELLVTDTKNKLNVSNNVFGSNFNKNLVHQVITAYIAEGHQGTKAQKSRAEVTGSGKKPWRQKGTGRARSGSTQSPIWRSGGVTFAAKYHEHTQKINKKMYRGALKNIFSKLVLEERLIIVQQFSIEVPRSKLLIQKLKDMALNDVLIITHEIDNNLLLASRNLYKVSVNHVKNINPISLITFSKIIITINAIKHIEALLI